MLKIKEHGKMIYTAYVKLLEEEPRVAFVQAP
jgi:hypothetical protein